MDIVLLSGGSGKRLWPLSNDIRSKQFLRLFQDDAGNLESMVQRVYRQITEVAPDSTVVIATGGSQVSAIRNQLDDRVGICAEPSRRDTFPAIALASAYLHSEKGLSEDDVVIICPVDPYVNLDYFKALARLEAAAKAHKAKLTLLGVKPTYPSAKYGYILPEESGEEVRRVLSFREKPDEAAARGYIEQGALWNCGVFAFRLGYLLSILREFVPFDTYQEVFDHYDQLPKISFDYAVAEKEPDINCVEFSGDWKDVGTWNTLAEEMSTPVIGNVLIGSACQDVQVINELETPLLVMGASHMVIAASADGILVSSKDQSSYIKSYVDQIEGRAMFEEKAWGTFTVLSMDGDYVTGKLTVIAGKAIQPHQHQERTEVWTVLSGEGIVTLDGRDQHVNPGDVVRLPQGSEHGLRAVTEMRLIEVQIPLLKCL